MKLYLFIIFIMIKIGYPIKDSVVNTIINIKIRLEFILIFFPMFSKIRQIRLRQFRFNYYFQFTILFIFDEISRSEMIFLFIYRLTSFIGLLLVTYIHSRYGRCCSEAFVSYGYARSRPCRRRRCCAVSPLQWFVCIPY